MNDWHIEVPSDQRVLAHTGDNLSYRIEIQCDRLDDNLSYKLDIENKYYEKDIVDLNRSGSILWATIRKDYLIANGTVRLQVRGINGSIVRHSNVFLAEIGYSIDGPSYFSDSDLSEFEQIEARITELKEETIRYVEDAKAAVELAVTTPYIGDNGNWYVYSHADKKYVDSGYPSSRKGDQGIQGPKGETGQDGRSFTLKAMYPTYEDMVQAHPAGITGDAYCVGTKDSNEVWFWSEEKSAWEDLGTMKGAQGESGQQGIQGIQGIPGKSATITIGSVQTIPTGSNAEVSNIGSETDAVLSFKIPEGKTGETGAKGDAATIQIGTVTTVGKDEQAEVINTGTNHDVVLNFRIPKGETGAEGKSVAVKGRYDTLESLMESHPNGTTGDAYVIGFGDDSYLYIWNEDIEFWDNLGHFQIAQGDPGISPTISIVNVTTGNPGTAASVSNVGTKQDVKLSFTIPAGNTGETGAQGPAGKGATVKIGEVITGESGSQASVVNIGTDTDAILRITLPRGIQGQKGNTGNAGAQGISITNASVNSDYHLIITLSTGETIDAGYVRGATGNTGATGAQGPKGDTPTSIPASGVTGVMTLQQGGTGKTTASDALNVLIDGSSAITSAMLSDSDYVAVSDTSDSAGKKLAISDLKATISDSVKNGTVSAANKLATARTIRTNLASTSTVSFDGSANVTPGVTGTLAIGNGGTGATTGAKGLYNLINPATALTTLADTDYIGVVDTSDTTGKKITVANLKSVIGSSSGSSDTAASANKLATARSFRTNLSSTSAVSFDGTADVTPGVTGTLTISNGGTGATTGAKGLYNLVNPASALTSLADNDYIGVIDVSATTGKKITFADLKSAIGSTGSGTSTGNYLPITGGTLTGDLRIKGSGNYGTKINLGDSEYVYISEPTDDHLEIKGDKQINLVTQELLLNGEAFPTGGSSSSGTASSADKLSTARTIRTNLASTSAASFDGTSNITPGVTGTLGLLNGGTGGTSAATALYNLISGASVLSATTSSYIPVQAGSSGGKISISALASLIGGGSSGGSSGGGSSVTVGTYAGSSSNSSGLTKTINLNFQPKAVFVYAIGETGGFRVYNSDPDNNTTCSVALIQKFGFTTSGAVDNIGDKSVLKITSTGFQVGNSGINMSGALTQRRLDDYGETYCYLAIS